MRKKTINKSKEKKKLYLAGFGLLFSFFSFLHKKWGRKALVFFIQSSSCPCILEFEEKVACGFKRTGKGFGFATE